jgi:hypothetical protein
MLRSPAFSAAFGGSHLDFLTSRTFHFSKRIYQYATFRREKFVQECEPGHD